jgi:arylsulfatase A-like enzyme
MSETNVLLLIFDTLRADAISPYGSELDTPAFDRVAEAGTTFERAYSAAPGTTPSHGAIFSGRYPSETGTFSYMEDEMPSDVPLMASWLSEAGYDTLGMTGPSGMGSHVGYDRGFAHYFEPYYEIPSFLSTDYLAKMSGSKHRREFIRAFLETALNGPDGHTRLKFDLLKSYLRDGLDRPFFAMVNFPIVHDPYNAPRPYKENRVPELDRRRFDFLDKLLGKREEIHREDIRDDRVLGVAYQEDEMYSYVADSEYLTDEELELVRELYQAQVSYADDQLGQFLDWFEREGFDDETIVIVTSDHGEFFGEHGLMLHGRFLFDEVTHVPLLVSGPGVEESAVRDDFVSLVDLFDTVCDLVKVPAPQKTSGISMFGGETREYVCLEEGRSPIRRNGVRKYLSDEELHRWSIGRKAIRDDAGLYVYNSDGGEHLYESARTDIPVDRPITEPDSDRLDRYRTVLFESVPREFTEPEDDGAVDDLDSEVATNLRELGYID